MKHRRGINIGSNEATYLGPLMDPAHTTFEDIPEWNTIGAHCSKCEREAWLNRFEVEKKWSRNVYLGSLTHRLRCRGCGSKGTSKWILGQLPR